MPILPGVSSTSIDRLSAAGRTASPRAGVSVWSIPVDHLRGRVFVVRTDLRSVHLLVAAEKVDADVEA
jgi:hypothetical protein